MRRRLEVEERGDLSSDLGGGVLRFMCAHCVLLSGNLVRMRMLMLEVQGLRGQSSDLGWSVLPSQRAHGVLFSGHMMLVARLYVPGCRRLSSNTDLPVMFASHHILSERLLEKGQYIPHGLPVLRGELGGGRFLNGSRFARVGRPSSGSSSNSSFVLHYHFPVI